MQPGVPQQGVPFPQAGGQRQAPQRDFVRPEAGYPAAGDRRTGPIPAATSGIFGGSEGPPAGTTGGFRGADAAPATSPSAGGIFGGDGSPAGSAAAGGTYIGAFVPNSGPATTNDPGMYVYRDDGGPDEPASAQAASATADQDADYWYGPAEPEQPTQQQEARGPFEPLRAGGAPGAEWAQPDAALSDNTWAPADESVDEERDDDARHAQKLEQIKDFYMTAEAIGEENVDKHFDQLLAQQRDLLDQYFKGAKDRIAAAAGQDDNTSAETVPGENAPDGTAGTAQAGTAQAGASASTDW
jgi:hypothetical protein